MPKRLLPEERQKRLEGWKLWQAERIQKKRKSKSKRDWRDAILNHLGRKCINCGRIEFLELHHIVPLKDDGEHTISNICVLCIICHKKAHKREFLTDDDE